MAERSKIYYRTKLLTAISDKRLTNATGGIVIQAVVDAPEDEKEIVAEKLLKVVKESETEEEIVAECLLKLVKECKTEDEIINRLKV